MQYMEDGKLAQRFRVLLHSSSDVIEVFLVQHVAQPGEGGEAGQADAAAGAAPGVGNDAGPIAAACGASGHEQEPRAAAAADLSMEPPGGLAGSSAAPAASARLAALQASNGATGASPISLLAKAIGGSGLSAAELDFSATMVKSEPGAAAATAAAPRSGAAAPSAAAGSLPGGSTPNFAAIGGLNSPLFPPNGLTSPSLACASPAQHAKWSVEVDPDVWFEGEGGALGALGDYFKNDTSSIFQQQQQQQVQAKEQAQQPKALPQVDDAPVDAQARTSTSAATQQQGCSGGVDGSGSTAVMQQQEPSGHDQLEPGQHSSPRQPPLQQCTDPIKGAAGASDHAGSSSPPAAAVPAAEEASAALVAPPPPPAPVTGAAAVQSPVKQQPDASLVAAW
jgi:hypothetical protein